LKLVALGCEHSSIQNGSIVRTTSVSDKFTVQTAKEVAWSYTHCKLVDDFVERFNRSRTTGCAVPKCKHGIAVGVNLHAFADHLTVVKAAMIQQILHFSQMLFNS
jgi:hypothetical protein